MPPGSPRARLARALARACLRGRDSGPGPGAPREGGGVGRMARGSSANRRAPLRPPDVARGKMLQPWTAPRSASQVRGAAAKRGSAAGTAAVSQARWEVREGNRGPRKDPHPPTSASLAGWHVTESSSGHLMSWLCGPGQGMHSARLGVGGLLLS